MFLTFIALDKSGRRKKYSWWFASMELALDTLVCLEPKGRQILWAELVDNQQRIPLPLSVLDGQHFLQPMQQLQTQWQELLEQPPFVLSDRLN